MYTTHRWRKCLSALDLTMDTKHITTSVLFITIYVCLMIHTVYAYDLQRRANTAGCLLLTADLNSRFVLGSSNDIRTVDECISFCTTRYTLGYTPVGIRNTTCFCSRVDLTIIYIFGEQVALSNCSSPCVGNSDEFCGSPPDIYSLYTVDNRTCDPIDPGILINGSHTGSDFSIGSEVTFSCDPGLVLNGSAVTRCWWANDDTADVEWDPLPSTLACVDPNLQTTSESTASTTTTNGLSTSTLTQGAGNSSSGVIGATCGSIALLIIIIVLVIVITLCKKRHGNKRKAKISKGPGPAKATLPPGGVSQGKKSANDYTEDDFDDDYLVPNQQVMTQLKSVDNRPRLPAPTSLKNKNLISASDSRESTYENTMFMAQHLKTSREHLDKRNHGNRPPPPASKEPAYQNRDIVSRHVKPKMPKVSFRYPGNMVKPKPKPKPKTNSATRITATTSSTAATSHDANDIYQNASVSFVQPARKLVPRMPTIGWNERPSEWEQRLPPPPPGKPSSAASTLAPPVTRVTTSKTASTLSKQTSADYITVDEIATLNQEVYENAEIRPLPSPKPRRPPTLASTRAEVVDISDHGDDSGGHYLEILAE